MTRPLNPDQLYRHCPEGSLPFETTADLEGLEQIIGQERALQAVRFGVGMRSEGYNLYVLGPAGLGKHTVLRRLLEQQSSQQPVPDDWCYVNNFDHPHKPITLRLPPAQGEKFRREMEQLVDDLRTAIPAAFESEQYRNRAQEIEEEFKERQGQAFSELGNEAEKENVAFMHTPTGFAFAPTRDGEVVSPSEYEKLPAEEQERLQRTIAELQDKLKKILRQVPQWRKDNRKRIKELNREVTMFAVGHQMEELKREYADHPGVLAYLNDVEQDIVENVDDFRKQEEEQQTLFGVSTSPTPSFRRYEVNVLVEHGDTQGAPVVIEDNPVYQNLVGRAEHMSQMGTLVTDFTLIKPGALHKANGGYLILDARKVLLAPYAWEGLKRALSSRCIRIESLGEMLSIISTVSLQPEPIPLEVKVMLVGERLLYYLLQFYDPEFGELFKVAADFDEEVVRDEASNLLYARLVGTIARQEGLPHFSRSAVARIVEHGARLAGDAERLSTHMRSIADLLRESAYWAREASQDLVQVQHVNKAIDNQIYRVDRIREKVHEAIRRGTILIDTTGEVIGQVNGLSVVQLGDFAFGQPSRITATARLGDGKIVDIEREVELGGAIHSKGVLILGQFLAWRYACARPLSLSASLVFEQSYGMVEGDSASAAELCTLLSALAEVPIKQSLAMTGSVNQRGQIQAIGGVNEKIEGFFDVCQAKGPEAAQGVLIPASNVKHLMLRQDVVEAAAAGQFQVYAVETIDQAMEVLTDMPAGEADPAGTFPEDTVNRRIQDRLEELTELALAFAKAKEEHHEDESD